MAKKRLIDANFLDDRCRRQMADEWNKKVAPVSWSEAYKEFLDDVWDAPTVDAVEVVHGRWEDVFKGNCAWERYKCSVCGGYALYRHEQVFDEWKTVQVLANYCPYCGAYMENGEENGEM